MTDKWIKCAHCGNEHLDYPEEAAARAALEEVEWLREALRTIAAGGLWGQTDRSAFHNIREFARAALLRGKDE